MWFDRQPSSASWSCLPQPAIGIFWGAVLLHQIAENIQEANTQENLASPGTKILQLLCYFLINTNEVITSTCVLNIHKTSKKIQKQHLTCSVSLYAHSDHCIHCFPSVCALSVMRVTPRTWHKLCNPTWVTKFPQNSREKTISHH